MDVSVSVSKINKNISLGEGKKCGAWLATWERRPVQRPLGSKPGHKLLVSARTWACHLAFLSSPLKWPHPTQTKISEINPYTSCSIFKILSSLLKNERVPHPGAGYLQNPQASRSDSARAFSLCTWQVSASSYKDLRAKAKAIWLLNIVEQMWTRTVLFSVLHKGSFFYPLKPDTSPVLGRLSHSVTGEGIALCLFSSTEALVNLCQIFLTQDLWTSVCA